MDHFGGRPERPGSAVLWHVIQSCCNPNRSLLCGSTQLERVDCMRRGSNSEYEKRRQEREQQRQQRQKRRWRLFRPAGEGSAQRIAAIFLFFGLLIGVGGYINQYCIT